MAGGKRSDPYRNYNFYMEIDGISQAGFQEVSGLDSTTETIEFREGGENTMVYKLPGKTSYSDIVLKWGITNSDELFAWRKAVINGRAERKNCSIILLDTAGEEKLRWNIINAWPTKWEGPSFNATADDVAIESLTLAHEGIDKG